MNLVKFALIGLLLSFSSSARAESAIPVYGPEVEITCVNLLVGPAAVINLLPDIKGASGMISPCSYRLDTQLTVDDDYRIRHGFSENFPSIIPIFGEFYPSEADDYRNKELTLPAGPITYHFEQATIYDGPLQAINQKTLFPGPGALTQNGIGNSFIPELQYLDVESNNVVALMPRGFQFSLYNSAISCEPSWMSTTRTGASTKENIEVLAVIECKFI